MSESKSDLIDKIIECNKALDEASMGTDWYVILDPSHPLFNIIQRNTKYKTIPSTRMYV